MAITILCTDWIEGLRELDDKSVQCVVTSPPYWGLRDYGVEGQLGLEETPDEYVGKLVDGFREMRRVLKDDGTFWLNLGDTYSGGMSGPQGNGQRKDRKFTAEDCIDSRCSGLKEKNLVMIPHRVALALQSDGWWIRNDIIWHKPNPMPESVSDRCTTSHEHIFLLTRSNKYKFNQDAIREEAKTDIKKVKRSNRNSGHGKARGMGEHPDREGGFPVDENGRNKRDVWEITTKPFSDAHFAVFPAKLPETCIKAGTDERDTVLDPFCGAGTTGLVADRLRRDFIGIELNEEYCEMARERIQNDAPMFAEVD